MCPTRRMVLTGIVVLLAAEVSAHAQTITSFDAPNAVYTSATSINNAGSVTGGYTTGSCCLHGYIRDADGTSTSFDVMSAELTAPLSINNRGAVTGYYATSGADHGFIRDAGGTITSFNPVGGGSARVVPESINDSGTVAGWYQAGFSIHAFIRDAGGTITIFDVLGSQPGSTEAHSINNAGQVTGAYVAGGYHGFIRDADGTFTSFDVPGSGRGTTPFSINNHGEVTGSYADQMGNTHGFIRESSDTTPPVITPTISGTMGPNGWYRSNVSVVWSAADPESGVASSNGCSGTTLTADTTGVTLTCSATNGAGLSNSVPVTIKIDKTAP